MKRSTKETVAFWEGKISEWEKSGLSREKFFQKEGLNRSTGGYWFRKLQREGGQEGFVEITPTEVISVSREGLKVTVRGKYTIEIGDNNFSRAVAHVRRKYNDASKLTKKRGSAEAALEKIGKIYAIEKDLRDKGLLLNEFAEQRISTILKNAQYFIYYNNVLDNF